jgi:hypothetical protein
MESLKRYNDYCASFQANKDKLLADKAINERHLTLFQSELETAQLLNDKARIDKAQKGVDLVSKRLDVVLKDLESMDSRPLAEQVLSESEELMGQLNQAVDQQWQRAREKRIEFLRELEELGRLRRQSQELSWATQAAMLDLNRNPLEEIRFGVNRLDFIVDQDLVDKYLR